MKVYVVTKYLDYPRQWTCVDSVWYCRQKAETRAKEIDNIFNEIEIFNIDDHLGETQ